MQAVKPDNRFNTTTHAERGLSLSMEMLAYALLIMLALIFRVADLDIVPLTDAEALQANASWHVLNPDAPGQAGTPESPIVFWLQHAFFSILGPSEFSARLPGLIGGLLLVLMPLLYRRWFGVERAFLASLLLAFGPIALMASRAADPVVWSLLSALVLIWAAMRYWESRSASYAYMAAAAAGGLFFLSDSGGPLLGLILLISAWFSLRGSAELRDVLRSVPWQPVVLTLVLVVVVTSTGFMVYPAGLGHVAALWSAMLSDWSPSASMTLFGLPVLTLLFYHAWLVFFGIAGYVLLHRSGQFPFAARFLLMWLGIASLILLFYRGAEASAALWLSVPLIALAAYAGVELMRPFAVAVYWSDSLLSQTNSPYSYAYGWVKWALALATLAILLMLGVHMQEIGRGLLIMPDGAGLESLAVEGAYIKLRYSSIWLVVMILFVLVGYMLSISVWGTENSLQGLGLGAFIFMIGTGLGSGWNASVVNAANPAELWHTQAITNDAYTLRATLMDLTRRDTGGELYIPVTVVADEDVLRSDGVVAWLLRDFVNVSFVSTASEAQRAQIILMPESEESPVLGGNYVGQSYAIRRHADLSGVRLRDLPALLGQRRLRERTFETDRVILWLRQDVYDGVPADQRP